MKDYTLPSSPRTPNPSHMPPTGEETHWIENLALDELNMDTTGIVHFSEYFDPSLFLEESSIKLMDDLKEKFEFFITKFNLFRSNGSDQSGNIRLFKISNTVNDFMLFRHSLKLIVTRKSSDSIHIGILSNGRTSLYANDAPEAIRDFFHEIKAHVGPFNEVSFRYNGEVINVASLVRYYLTEFIRQSAK